jgi:hypothetical protein
VLTGQQAWIHNSDLVNKVHSQLSERSYALNNVHVDFMCPAFFLDESVFDRSWLEVLRQVCRVIHVTYDNQPLCLKHQAIQTIVSSKWRGEHKWFCQNAQCKLLHGAL